MTGIHRVIDGAVADALVVHDLHDFRDGTYILLSFPVQFHIRDVSTAGDGVERSFAPDLLGDADRFLHIHMEGIDVVVAVRHAVDLTVFPSVYLGETLALRSFNQQLTLLGEVLGLNDRLSSYTARHTWATTAYYCEIHPGIISEAMGHSSIKVTETYLKPFRNKKIDEANNQIIDFVKHSIAGVVA